jgi:hypothetical protein
MLPVALPELLLESYSSTLPGALPKSLCRQVPDWANLALPERLLGRVKSYSIMYLALPKAYPIALPGRVTPYQLRPRSFT